jgi:hypothetical protein
MTNRTIVRLRQVNQSICPPSVHRPEDAVRMMGAIQAQDYRGALWAIGLRARNSTERSIERAVAERKIIRTWPMRGTLHFVSPSEVRWMLKYLTPHIVARAASRFRQLHLDDATFNRCRAILEKLLRGGNLLTREAIYASLEKNRISCAGQRGIHMLWKLAQDGVICFGPREGKQPTFVLLEEWIPPAKIPSLQEAIATLAKRFFKSHGPATIKDFIWWSGLQPAVARSGLDCVKESLRNNDVGGQAMWFPGKTEKRRSGSRSIRLLPAFDEYLVGYKDRSAVIDVRDTRKALPGGGVLRPTLVIEGRIRGTWKRTILKDKVMIQIDPFITLRKSLVWEIESEATRYGEFLDKDVVLKFRQP